MDELDPWVKTYVPRWRDSGSLKGFNLEFFREFETLLASMEDPFEIQSLR